VLVGDADLAGRDELVFGGDLAGERYADRRPRHGDQHAGADEPAA
jgi:hypothetical protein